MSQNIVKLGGFAGILAAALLLIVAVIDQVAPVGVVYDSPNEYVYSAVSMVAFLAVVLAVVGVWALKSRTSLGPGSVGVSAVRCQSRTAAVS